jgi:hypothetical protein
MSLQSVKWAMKISIPTAARKSVKTICERSWISMDGTKKLTLRAWEHEKIESATHAAAKSECGGGREE